METPELKHCDGLAWREAVWMLMLYPQGQLTEHLARGEPGVLWAGGAMGLTYGSITQISTVKCTDFSLTSAFLWFLSLKWAGKSPVSVYQGTFEGSSV